MKTKILGMVTAAGLLFGSGMLWSQELVITSIERPGKITWSGSSLNVTCHVEWASSAEGPWYRTWANQRSILVTGSSNAVEVPMFYRVVCDVPDPHFTDITTTQALDLLAARDEDPEFKILDVRTAGEYSARHISKAVNLDFFSPTFASELDVLDKNDVYLIYCASGNRSGQAHDIMLGLGFHEVYNMLGGMSAFLSTPGADSVLEP